MQLNTSFYYFKSALDKDFCEKIIEAGEEKIAISSQKGQSIKGYTAGDGQKEANKDAIAAAEMTKEEMRENGIKSFYDRDSTVSWLNDMWIYEAIHPYIHEANKLAGWNFDWDYSEPSQFTVYEPDGFYSWHSDGGSDHYSVYKRYIHGVTDLPMRDGGRFPEKYVNDPGMVGKVRKLSVTVTLNDPLEYDGGNLKFDLSQHAENQQFHTLDDARAQGTIIVFPSFLPHCVTPVTRGKRKSLVIWNLGYPFK